MVDPLNLILILAAAALLPFLAIVATSFIKLSIVFLLLRNALGVQQIPPNSAVNALAIILSAYIMAPIIVEIAGILSAGNYRFDSVESVQAAYNSAKVPLIEWLERHADEREKTYFLQAAGAIWPENMQDMIAPDAIAILLPAFTVSQLREAFEIGFLLYLPFIAIDLIVSNILLAMGMMMVSPLTISLPFKLFLFVMVDGWSLLILGLVTTYS